VKMGNADLTEPETFYEKFIEKFGVKCKNKDYKHIELTPKEWTELIEEAISDMECEGFSCAGHHPNQSESGQEFLRIDHCFFSKKVDYSNLDYGNIPLIAIEHENESINNEGISNKSARLYYNFNKLFATISKLKVLIGYVKETEQKNAKTLMREFAESIKLYITNASEDYFTHQKSYFLLILGEEKMLNWEDDFTAYYIDEKGTIITMLNRR